MSFDDGHALAQKLLENKQNDAVADILRMALAEITGSDAADDNLLSDELQEIKARTMYRMVDHLTVGDGTKMLFLTSAPQLLIETFFCSLMSFMLTVRTRGCTDHHRETALRAPKNTRQLSMRSYRIAPATSRKG